VEPIRQICDRFKSKYCHYYQAKAHDIDFNTYEVICSEKGTPHSFRVKFDFLVIACGARNNTFGTQGVKEYSHFLKEIKHVRAIRSHLLSNLEHASLPCISKEDRANLLHTVVVGGGPTGVEFAAELHDFLDDDISDQFPHLAPLVKVTLIQSNDHILNTYDEKISQYAEKEFRKHDIKLVTGARVKEVTPDAVVYIDKQSKQEVRVPFGLCVWSTG
jgi:NADH dehydrogenase FAD-containing subunit